VSPISSPTTNARPLSDRINPRPESPSWLIAVGRNEEARAIFVKYHAEGDQNSTLVEFEMAEVEQTAHFEEAAANQTSYMDMLRTKGNRH
jgi:hypothetical protein